MEQLNQLKTMRGEALDRLQSNSDYRLLMALDGVIDELEGIENTLAHTLKVVGSPSSSEDLGEAMEKMTAELGDSLKDDQSKASFN